MTQENINYQLFSTDRHWALTIRWRNMTNLQNSRGIARRIAAWPIYTGHHCTYTSSKMAGSGWFSGGFRRLINWTRHKHVAIWSMWSLRWHCCPRKVDHGNSKADLLAYIKKCFNLWIRSAKRWTSLLTRGTVLVALIHVTIGGSASRLRRLGIILLNRPWWSQKIVCNRCRSTNDGRTAENHRQFSIPSRIRVSQHTWCT